MADRKADVAACAALLHAEMTFVRAVPERPVLLGECGQWLGVKVDCVNHGFKPFAR